MDAYLRDRDEPPDHLHRADGLATPGPAKLMTPLRVV